MQTNLIFCVICILQAVVQIECVVGGQIATDGQFPYQESIQETNTARDCGHHYAGGVIVSTRIVLTAASTLGWATEDPKNMSIVFGTIDRCNLSKIMDIERITLHPSFNIKSMQNDIGVVRTRKAFVFTEFVKSLLLPTLDLPVQGGTKATISGWNKPGPDHFSTTETISTANCRRHVQELIGKHVITDTNVCTTNPVNIGICRGDEGSPLVDENQIVIGIASWTPDYHRHCANGYPDVYTRVHPYVEWIDSVTNSAGPAPNTIYMIPALIIFQIFDNLK